MFFVKDQFAFLGGSMSLTSEQVHWLFGLLLVVTAILLILRSLGFLNGRWPDYIIPLALAVFGIELAIDPLVHGEALPANYAGEMAQHFVISGVLLAASIAELLRVAKRGRTLWWRLPLAIALALTAGILWLHTQHDMGPPTLLLTTQHRMIGTTIAAAALAVLFTAVRDNAEDDDKSIALPLLILALGVQLLAYTEASNLPGMTAH
jgi:hypothetical protein